MTCCKPPVGTPERSEYEAGYGFTRGWAKHQDADAIDDERFTAESNLTPELSTLQTAYWRGVLTAIKERLGESPTCSCDAAGKVA